VKQFLALVLLIGLVGFPTATARGQGYRLRVDARGQSVIYRGLALDSIPIDEAETGPSGGLVSPDGIQVNCGASWCYLYRPGPDLRALPVSVAADLILWGLGIRGLTVHLNGRLLANPGDQGSWPGTEPAAQLLEGYAEYDAAWLTARAGRLLVSSRLFPMGFDGGWARGRWAGPGLEAVAYGGWGLGRAAVLPVTSPELNPLDEWRPAERQLVMGAGVAWQPGPAEVRAEYRREVDPDADYLVSERAAVSFSGHPLRSILLTGGLEYNLDFGTLGSADATATWIGQAVTAAVGARRYRPYFDLWTLWGAFSPVPYNAVTGSLQARLWKWLELRGRGERYWYEAAEASTALVTVENDGWRYSLGASAQLSGRWTVDGSYQLEFGPGASARFFDLGVRYQPVDRLQVSAYGGRLFRPLELRYYDATTIWVGSRAEWTFADGMRVWGDAAWYADERDRPDPAATEWDQVRVRGGLSFTFGTNADRLAGLPPGRRSSP
jgi:hypothetical protein